MLSKLHTRKQQTRLPFVGMMTKRSCSQALPQADQWASAIMDSGQPERSSIGSYVVNAKEEPPPSPPEHLDCGSLRQRSQKNARTV